MLNAYKTFAAIILANALCTVAHAQPAFDCNEAEGEVENLICSNDDLQKLDQSLAITYAQAMQNLPEQDQTNERAMQRGWIKGRNDCWKSDDVESCVTYSYHTRIVELQIRSGALEAPGFILLSCEEEPNKRLTASFYNETEPHSVVLTLDNDQVIAFSTRSASGARYQASNVDFWTKGKEASLDWFGTSLKCVLP
ncbi:MAG: MliC family protein [Halioglobus sp.]